MLDYIFVIQYLVRGKSKQIHIQLGHPEARGWMRRYRSQLEAATMIGIQPHIGRDLPAVYISLPEGASPHYFVRTTGQISTVSGQVLRERQTLNVGYAKNGMFIGNAVDEDGNVILIQETLEG